jgi:hypothetical protein
MKNLGSISVGSCVIVMLFFFPIFSNSASGQIPECAKDADCPDDGNVCTTEFCDVDGTCQAFQLGCISLDPCQISQCNPDTGRCESNPRPDGTSCGGAAECRGGTCKSTLCDCGNPDALGPDDGSNFLGKTYIFGTSKDDIICGSFGDDVIIAWGGNDCIDSRAGDDLVFAGTGDDMVDGGDGFDKIVGGIGEDICIGGEKSFACEFDVIPCGTATCPDGFFCNDPDTGLCCKTDGGTSQCVIQ